jgi:hypothetical protein
MHRRSGRLTAGALNRQNACISRALSRADAQIRTGDPFITSEVLYQLSYVGDGGSSIAPVSPAHFSFLPFPSPLSSVLLLSPFPLLPLSLTGLSGLSLSSFP